MLERKIVPYGGWPSSLSAEWIADDAVSLGQLCLDGSDVYWSEVRANDKGRSVVCKLGEKGVAEDFSPPNSNVRSRVHEYGGGAYCVERGELWYSNVNDSRVWHKSRDGTAVPITSGENCRYADLVRDPNRNQLIAVSEEHIEGIKEPYNRLIGIRETGDVVTLVEGADFYASPTLSNDGKWLSWLSWDHPCMPWDGTLLWRAPIENDGSVGERVLLAGGSNRSIFQPTFAPDGTLYFVSDQSGWWNLYRLRENNIELVLPLEAECGVPQWNFGLSTYGFASEHLVVISYIVDGLSKLATVDLRTSAFSPIHSSFVDISGLKAGDGRVIFVGGSLLKLPAVASINLETKEIDIIYQSGEANLGVSDISRPTPVSIPVGKNETTHGFFYQPRNASYVGPSDALPPLIVKCHGGPTGQTSTALNLKTQYWTTRGFAVLDVNYRGSSGYGRAYREKLNGKWGLADVEDCVSGANWLAAKGWVDGGRMAISGSSAGGYTTLCAITFAECFAAGASYYGIGDLSKLAKETHKFESSYLDILIGSLAEENPDISDRSPINSVEMLTCPVIFFQGLEDKVVSPAQAEAMVTALRKNGIPVAYLPFSNEGHGFRQSENIKRALEGELYFYGRVFGFQPADNLPTVSIENARGLSEE